MNGKEKLNKQQKPTNNGNQETRKNPTIITLIIQDRFSVEQNINYSIYVL